MLQHSFTQQHTILQPITNSYNGEVDLEQGNNKEMMVKFKSEKSKIAPFEFNMHVTSHFGKLYTQLLFLAAAILISEHSG